MSKLRSRANVLIAAQRLGATEMTGERARDPRTGKLEFEAFYRWYSTLDHGWAGPVLNEQGM